VVARDRDDEGADAGVSFEEALEASEQVVEAVVVGGSAVGGEVAGEEEEVDGAAELGEPGGEALLEGVADAPEEGGGVGAEVEIGEVEPAVGGLGRGGARGRGGRCGGGWGRGRRGGRGWCGRGGQRGRWLRCRRCGAGRLSERRALVEETGGVDLGEAGGDGGELGEREGAGDVGGGVGGEALVEDGAEVTGGEVAEGAGEADRVADVGGDVASEVVGVAGGDDDEGRGALELGEEAPEAIGGDPVGSARALEDEDAAAIAVAGEVEDRRGEVVEAVEEVVEGGGVDAAEVVAIAEAGALEGLFDGAGLFVEAEAGVGVSGVGGGEEDGDA
jgi:hypothetical protein